MAANVIVPVRGVSCIYVCREWLQVSQQVIVPVRGVSCIYAGPGAPVARPGHRPREGSELHHPTG